MTTFTLQDLGVATPEEEEAFKALAQELTKHKEVEKTSTIQGATGAQYTPINPKDYYKPIEQIRAEAERKQPVSFEGALRSLIREEVLKALAERDTAWKQ